jgi:monoamine oxidase
MAAAVDVAVIGAGPAGIAAGRILAEAGLSAVVLEARDRVGGRVVTVHRAGVALDLGAHWLHAGPVNPIVCEARRAGVRLRPAPLAGHLLVEGRPADAAVFDRAFARADACLSRPGPESTCAARLPLLGRWRRPVGAITALVGGRSLDELSAADFASAEYADNLFAPGGFGTLLARLARGLEIRLGSLVTDLDQTGRNVRVSGPFGVLEARAAILTLPPALLARGAIRFSPALPPAWQDAVNAFRPGVYEHVVVEWPDMPFSGADRIATVTSRRLAGLGLLTRIDGGPRAYVELDARAIEELSLGCARRKAGFVREVLRREVGLAATRHLRVIATTGWLQDPLSRCAWSTLPPGAAGARAVLTDPADSRILFAGEATDHGQWGTAGGAWASGQRAAAALVARLRPR